jgi:hypothetical protein
MVLPIAVSKLTAALTNGDLSGKVGQADAAKTLAAAA